MAFNESFIKKAQALIAAKEKKPPGLRRWLLKGLGFYGQA
jgi:hypothetical protein